MALCSYCHANEAIQFLAVAKIYSQWNTEQLIISAQGPWYKLHGGHQLARQSENKVE